MSYKLQAEHDRLNGLARFYQKGKWVGLIVTIVMFFTVMPILWAIPFAVQSITFAILEVKWAVRHATWHMENDKENHYAN